MYKLHGLSQTVVYDSFIDVPGIYLLKLMYTNNHGGTFIKKITFSITPALSKPQSVEYLGRK